MGLAADLSGKTAFTGAYGGGLVVTGFDDTGAVTIDAMLAAGGGGAVAASGIGLHRRAHRRRRIVLLGTLDAGIALMSAGDQDVFAFEVCP